MQRHVGRRVVGLLPLMFVLVACSGGAAIETVAPTAPGTPAASPGGATSGTGDTLDTASVGSLGTVVVAGNGMTVYTYVNDVKDSKASACTGACLTTWPAVTVPTGATPTAGAGVIGTLGTFTRADDGTTQVTYNGLPVYYFSGDSAPGDGNGVYRNWEAVHP